LNRESGDKDKNMCGAVKIKREGVWEKTREQWDERRGIKT
jgi:hypothetical protein